ncbi:predicted protein [Naegleria gruberi]|uniref:Predicted protein n=1 Tax=Naegleria gruberi TaxID=5762 RepID=D2VUV6_NAEGR|nr:uncharacterized protein NAEGRDRAFT_81307 [Naegleria gruberi]EFC39332.1 predicted protein [Naegleria gruberi]|eukprot:XP_002672076.1 predicted protein [Naegleria gruberi strain NEG-M]
MTKDTIKVDFRLHQSGNLIEGFLKKKGKNLINRAPLRYVIVRKDGLYYFDVKKDEKNGQDQPDLDTCLGFINILDLQSVVGDESDNKLTITAEKKKKTKQFVFFTENKDSYTNWFNEVKKWESQKDLYVKSSPQTNQSTFSSGASSRNSAKSATNELTSISQRVRSSSSRLSLNKPIDTGGLFSQSPPNSGGGGALSGGVASGGTGDSSATTPSTPSTIISGSSATPIINPSTTNVTAGTSPTGIGSILNRKKTTFEDEDIGTEANISDEEDELENDEDDDNMSGLSARSRSSTRSRRSGVLKGKEKGNLFDLLNSQKLAESSVARRHSVMFDKVSDRSSVIFDDGSSHSGAGNRKNDEDQFDKRRFQNIMSIFPIEREHSRYFDDGKRVELTQPIAEVKEWEEELISFETKRSQKSEKVDEKSITTLVPHDFADAKEKCKETLQQEDKFCYWAHEVVWFNPRVVGNKNQYKEALLVLGNRNLYIIDSKSFKTETKVRVNDIVHIVQSGYEDDIVGIVRKKDREEMYDILFQFTETKKTRGADETSITVQDEERIRGKSFANSCSALFKEQENEIYLKKIEFFDYISAIFLSQRGLQLKIFFVNDVRQAVRTTEKEDPIDLNEKNILESTSILQIDKKHDFIKLYLEPIRCRVMSEFGDKQVLFAGLLGKKNKRNKYQNRTIVITNRALYVFDPKKQKSFKRRIKLSEISRVYRNKKKGVLIDVPSEYPLCLVPKQNMDVFEDFITVLSTLYFDKDLVQHVKDNEFDSFDLEKSQGFKEKMNETEDILQVHNQLRTAISSKDVNQVREYLAYADALVGKRDPQETMSIRDLRIQASEFLADVRLQEFIKEKLQTAFINRDFLEMSRMLDHIETIKKERGEEEIYKVLADYLKSIKTEKEVVINKHLLMTRIEYLLAGGVDTDNERRILEAVDIAKRAGFVKEVEKYKQEYDKEKQKIYIDQQIAEVIDRKKKNTSFDSDADRLICLIENAKALGIYEGKIQKTFEENTKDFITNKSNNHNFKSVIEQTRKDIESNHSKLKKEIEKVKIGAEGYTNIDKALVDEAEKVLKEIENIRKYQKKLNTILDKTEKGVFKLEEAQYLIEKCKKKLASKRKGYGETKDYRELTKRANNTYNELKRETKRIYKQEASNIALTLKKLLDDQQYDMLRQKLAQINTAEIKPALVAELPELQKIIDEVVDNLNTFDFMRKLSGVGVEKEYSYKDVEKVLKFKEFAERNPRELSEEQQESLEKIEKKVAMEFKLYNEIQEEKKRFKDISAEIFNFQKVEILLENVSDIPSLEDEAIELANMVRMKKTFNMYVREIQKRKATARSYDDILRKASKENIDVNILVGAAMTQKTNDVQLEDELNELIRRKDLKKLQDFIGKNSDTMPRNLLKMANAKLNNLRRENMSPLELIEQINNAIDVHAKEELLNAIEIANKLLNEDIAEQSKTQLQNAIERAQVTIKEITNKENIEKIKLYPQEFMKEALHSDDFDEIDVENDSFNMTRKLRQVQGLTDYSSLSREEKQKDNVFGQNLIKVLYDILNHKTKKRFFYLSKDPYEILSGLKASNDHIGKLVDSFDSNELVKRLKKEKKNEALSVQFIYYLLSERSFMFVVELLLTSDAYLKDCYELDSVVLDRRYRDDIYPLMSLLAMFQFTFSLRSSTDVLAASPVSRLKGIVRSIVHYFVSNRTETKSNLELSGKEDWEKSNIGELIRKKLVPTVAEIFNHKFKSGFISKYHIWQFIQDVAEQKRISAIDIGGINLPTAIDFVNEAVDNPLDFDFKFETFICYALNRGLMAEFFESILKDRSFLAKYYDQYALVLDKDVIGNTVKYFEIISQLPFDLIESSEKYNQKYNQ